jgi:hypothetical protein
MKYLILIYSNPASRDVWTNMSGDERASGLRYYAAMVEEMRASGELVTSEALSRPSRAKRVHATDAGTIASDGPFAEVKEHLAGFFVVECPDMDRAIELAARIPEAAYGLVEVWPTVDLEDLESER